MLIFRLEETKSKRSKRNLCPECILKALLKIVINSLRMFFQMRLVVLPEIGIFPLLAQFGDIVIEVQVDHADVGDDAVDFEKRVFAWL